MWSGEHLLRWGLGGRPAESFLLDKLSGDCLAFKEKKRKYPSYLVGFLIKHTDIQKIAYWQSAVQQGTMPLLRLKKEKKTKTNNQKTFAYIILHTTI